MKARDLRFLSVICIASISFAVALAEPTEAKPFAAVFEFEARLPGESVDIFSLTDIFQTAFVQAGAFRVVERSKLEKVLTEQEFQLSGITESGAARAGSLAGASKVVILSLSKAGSRYLAAAKCVDASSGMVDVAATIGDTSLDGIIALLPELAYKLSGKAPLGATVYSAPVLGAVVPRIGAAFHGGVFGNREAGDFSRVNEVAFEGLRLVAERYRGTIVGDPAGAKYGSNVQISFREAVPGSSLEEPLRSLAREGNGLVFAIGIYFNPAVVTVAREFPRVRFVILDLDLSSAPAMPNLSYMVFREHEGSFMAGALAALGAKETKGGNIGFIGGMDIPIIRKFRAGFLAGAASIDPLFKEGKTVQDSWVGSFSDPVKAEKLATGQYGGSVRVIYQASGNSGAGVVKAASKAGRTVIGVDYDQGLAYATSRDPAERRQATAVISSMIKRYDEAVLRASTAYLSAGLLPSGRIEFGLAEGGLGLAVNAYNQEAMARFMPALSELGRKVASGGIAVPWDDKSLARFLSSLGK